LYRLVRLVDLGAIEAGQAHGDDILLWPRAQSNQFEEHSRNMVAARASATRSSGSSSCCTSGMELWEPRGAPGCSPRTRSKKINSGRAPSARGCTDMREMNDEGSIGEKSVEMGLE